MATGWGHRAWPLGGATGQGHTVGPQGMSTKKGHRAKSQGMVTGHGHRAWPQGRATETFARGNLVILSHLVPPYLYSRPSLFNRAKPIYPYPNLAHKTIPKHKCSKPI